MDQRVSPRVTTWVAGSWPPPPCPGAGAGAACDVSGAACDVSGRACVVSCATSTGAGPGSSPATRASRAARSERQIVVLLIQGLRERVERFRLAPGLGCHLSGGLGSREIARALPTSATSASPRRQEDHFSRDDLGGVPRLLLPILPRAILDPPLDVDPVAFFHVLFGQIRELGAFVVPADDPVPLGLFLLLAPCPVHCRLVASDSVATREPLVVLRTSGSAPKFPISMTLLRLRLTKNLRTLGGSGTKGDKSIRPASHSVNQRYATCAKVLQTPRPQEWQRSRPPRPRPVAGNSGPAAPPLRTRALRTVAGPRRSTRAPRGTRRARPGPPARRARAPPVPGPRRDGGVPPPRPD